MKSRDDQYKCNCISWSTTFGHTITVTMQDGNSTPAAKRQRTNSRTSPLAARDTLKRTMTQKEGPILDMPLHVTLVCLTPASQDDITGTGEYDEEDVNLKDYEKKLADTDLPPLRNRRLGVLADSTG